MMNAVSDADTAWIELRSRCTIYRVFEDFYCLAKASVACANKIAQNADRFFMDDTLMQEHHQFDVGGQSIESRGRVDLAPRTTFRIDGNRITIDQNIVVTREWDAFEEKCHLRVSIDGKEDARQYTAAKVVQTALEPLFFG